MSERSQPDPDRTSDAWPEDGLEHLGKCPVCSGTARDVLYADLTDRVFGCAPGKWTLWKCNGCGCAYLDPRPNETSIGLAYANYYTHGAAENGTKRCTMRRALYERTLQAALNDQSNHTYGHKLQPAVLGGRWIGALYPRFARHAEALIRHLPPPATSMDTLLDIGCGDGSFLVRAREIGYVAMGLEPDEAAAAVAAAKGFCVAVSSLPGSSLPKNSFAHVTMHHVMEHLHDPVAALREVHALLRPGGRVWLATPNIYSPLLNTFHEHWRGLEPPRHLVLFTPGRITIALQEAGFASVQLMPPDLEARGMAFRSYSVMQGCLQARVPVLPTGWREPADRANRMAMENYELGETIYVVGYKVK